MCMHSANPKSVSVPIKTLTDNIVSFSRFKFVRSISHHAQARGGLRSGQRGVERRWEGCKHSDDAHLYIISLTTHQKRLFKSYFSEVPVTSSGQLVYSNVSNAANPPNFPISLRDATDQGSENDRFKRKLERFSSPSPYSSAEPTIRVLFLTNTRTNRS